MAVDSFLYTAGRFDQAVQSFGILAVFGGIALDSALHKGGQQGEPARYDGGPHDHAVTVVMTFRDRLPRLAPAEKLPPAAVPVTVIAVPLEVM